MRTLALVLLILAFASFVRAAEPEPSSEPESIVTVSPVKLLKLNAMHADAERLIAAGSLREAVAHYWGIILIEPDDDAAYTNLGELYLILGDTGRAKDAFQNALHIDPENEAAMEGFLKITTPEESPA